LPEIRAITINYPRIESRIISKVWITEACDPEDKSKPIPKSAHTNALWDTGGTTSSISSSIASDLGLAPIGARNVNHFGGSDNKTLYEINLYLPNEVTFAGIQVPEFDDRAGFGFIIGMDIINQSDFSITNFEDQTWVSFRLPSITRIDYVRELNKTVFADVGRNEKCPCGSGKKYKKCHGAG